MTCYFQAWGFRNWGSFFRQHKQNCNRGFWHLILWHTRGHNMHGIFIYICASNYCWRQQNYHNAKTHIIVLWLNKLHRMSDPVPYAEHYSGTQTVKGQFRIHLLENKVTSHDKITYFCTEKVARRKHRFSWIFFSTLSGNKYYVTLPILPKLQSCYCPSVNLILDFFHIKQSFIFLL